MIRTLKEYIKSVQGNGISDDWFSDGAFEAYKKPDRREPFTVAKNGGVIDTLEGPVKYSAGDYIMTGPNGEQYPIGSEKFQELKTDNGDGTASPKKIVKLCKVADHNGEVTLQYNGSQLAYHQGEDVIVRHGVNDYGVVKADIFKQTYERV
jgi:hypothetical protein